ncbi:MAG TPA: mannose-6-phosphate isomerase, class I [Bacilli bacterium]|mgnify:CR=1 FL=1|nr:mannose-6-phosphate isomerase, class I [Bacilli bacterium]
MDLLFLKEIYKKKIWGGGFFREKIPGAPDDGNIGEMWSVAAHPEGDAIIDNGTLAGTPLSKAYGELPALFNNPPAKKFPVLVKIIAAARDLSVQVHPGDEYAALHENDSGKTEGWLILRAGSDARIVYGHRASCRAELEEMVRSGRWEELLNYVSVKAGEFYPIPAGTLHAIGKDIVLLEIQQSSDLTYRLYDYDRLDEAGRPRPLHLRKALDVISISRPPQCKDAFASKQVVEEIWDNPYFRVYLINVNRSFLFPRFRHYGIATVAEGEIIVRERTLSPGKSFIVTGKAENVEAFGHGRLALTIPKIR